MKRELRCRWVAALRSGEYKQGKKKLRSLDDCYCCLGVLAILMNVATVVNPGVYDAYVFDFDTMPTTASLPMAFCKEVGLGWPEAQELILMNDGGASFAEIADWIEANVKVED